MARPLRIALVGTPNCGKTALFNQLTGGRQKVANYAGVTVERKEGQFATPSGRLVHLLDLPGAYSFKSISPDEQITYDVLRGHYKGEDAPDMVICVVDATNLRLHLRFVLEVMSLGLPVIIALNMMDAANQRQIVINTDRLEERLGVKAVETIAVRRDGVRALVEAIDQIDANYSPPGLAADIASTKDIHAQVRTLLSETVVMPSKTDARDDAIDRWVLHPVIGLIIMAAVMFMIFQAVYCLGKPLTDSIADGFDWLGSWLASFLPDGPVQGLVTDGLCAGLGTVLGFLPQILVLFFFILVLEESGYLPRAAFLLDRLMLSVGFSGRSFIPLLSSFACAIPGVIGTRSITDPRNRLATIFAAPLMTCSARLPVYALLIGAFIPARSVFHVFNLQGVVLFGLYVAGILGAVIVGWALKRLHRGQSEQILLMELPSYRRPRILNVAIGLWERGGMFLKRLTGVILALTVIMWAISTFPLPPAGATGPAIDYSIAGYLGRALHYIFAPLGFNWQISLSLIPAFAARETAVSALATVYAVSGDNGSGLASALAANIPMASALSLMVWFVFAPQCMSTLAIIRKETQSWRNVFISFGYMFGIAYLMSFLTYNVARWLG